MLIHPSGKTMTNDEAQKAIRETFALEGCFILGASVQPTLGEVRQFAGLPLKVTRYSTYEEAFMHNVDELWGPATDLDPEDFYFYVEVAD